MKQDSIKQVINDPRLKFIVRKKWRLSFALSAGMTAIYAAFVLVMVFKTAWLLPQVTSTNPFNTGLLLTFVMLVLIVSSMFCYLLFRGNDTHNDIHKLIAEYDEQNIDKPD